MPGTVLIILHELPPLLPKTSQRKEPQVSPFIGEEVEAQQAPVTHPGFTWIQEAIPGCPLRPSSCRAPGNHRSCAWCPHQRQESKWDQQGESVGSPTSSHMPTAAPPGHRPLPLTCPCTMAFSRASTACRASGGFSGCSRSATAFQSASTACCHQRRGDSD